MKYSENKSSNLKEVFKDINKKYGESAVGFAAENADLDIEVWDTNVFSLNYVLGNNGMAKGRVYEMFGLSSAGKTTAALHILSQIQKQGGKVCFIDAEFSFNADHAKKIGLNLDELVFAQPETGEQAFDLMEKLIHSGEIAAIVVDSTAALVPSHELEGAISDSNVALQARMISKGLRMLTGVLAKTKTIVIFISQVRSKIGSFIGPSSESSGGNALKFYASVRLEVAKIKTLKDGDKSIGNRLKITAVKNKVSEPFGKAEIDLYFNSGFDLYGEALEYGESLGVVSRSGNSYTFEGEKIGVGKDNAKLFLISNESLYEKLREAIKKCESEKLSQKETGKEGSSEVDKEESGKSAGKEKDQPTKKGK